PKDKAKAEVAVLVVERWIMARLRHHTFFSLSELNRAIADLLPELNSRPFQGRKESRQSLFEAIDRPALSPLPEQAYEYAQWHKAKPGIDYHVVLDKRLYSVPHSLVGQVLDLRVTGSLVEVMHKGKRVAIHPRHGQGRYSTLTEHMPKSHQAHEQWSPGRFLNWGRQIGPCTATVVKRNLDDRPHPEHGYRACMGLLQLSKRYTPQRLEQACERGLRIGGTAYSNIASILQSGLDQHRDDHSSQEQQELPLHDNLRGSDYYH
ncbi:MAG: transposase, partial [Gammaproteobacteria bacterium]|nr:transposase [Gammaproteobacteria bacterium]